jgi:glycosyltransferase involved in cell wall biosynthesis
MTRRIAIVATHPVQYQACWYRAISSDAEFELEVLFCHRATARDQAMAGFGVQFDWDIPLLSGYSSRFLNNVASHPSTSSFLGTDTPDIQHVLKRNRYDAVLVMGWHFKSAWQAIRGARRAGTPVLMRSDSHLYTKRSCAKRLLKNVLYPPAISRFDACLAVGKWSREYFVKYGARPDNVFTVPHCVDEELFNGNRAIAGQARNNWRRRLSLSEDQCVFLFSGKFVSTKRPFDFIAALSLVRQRGGKAVGVMVGDGVLRRDCEIYAQRIKAPIHFIGFLNQSEICHAYAGSDVLVVPSESETWGVVINEAMTTGRPCLVSDQVGAVPDLIQPGITGDVFEMGNVHALAVLMERYSADVAATRAMKTAVKQRIDAYSVRVALEGTKQAVEAVCHRS